MRFGLFWQTPGSAESSAARRHWETIEEIVLDEQLGFETAWLAETVAADVSVHLRVQPTW